MLALAATVMGLPQSRVDEMLDLVSLTDDEAARRVGDYSLGMRQRLGIAHAIGAVVVTAAAAATVAFAVGALGNVAGFAIWPARRPCGT